MARDKGGMLDIGRCPPLIRDVEPRVRRRSRHSAAIAAA